MRVGVAIEPKAADEPRVLLAVAVSLLLITMSDRRDVSIIAMSVDNTQRPSIPSAHRYLVGCGCLEGWKIEYEKRIAA